jgi:hypothetical protein
VKLQLEPVPDNDEPDAGLAVRLTVLNDSYEPVRIDHRLLIGPNVASIPRPVSAEPSTEDEADNFTVLNPWCFYGRQRAFGDVTGEVTFTAYLLASDDGGPLSAQGPVGDGEVVARAEPLVVEIG